MAAIAEANSLFEIDAELDSLLEAIEEQVASDGQPSEELVAGFQRFCDAHGDKVDRIGRFLRMMEARENTAGAKRPGSENGPAPRPARQTAPRAWCSITS